MGSHIMNMHTAIDDKDSSTMLHSPSSGGAWNCSICTYLNHDSLHLACEMCGYERVPDENKSTVVTDNDDDSSLCSSSQCSSMDDCSCSTSESDDEDTDCSSSASESEDDECLERRSRHQHELLDRLVASGKIAAAPAKAWKTNHPMFEAYKNKEEEQVVTDDEEDSSSNESTTKNQKPRNTKEQERMEDAANTATSKRRIKLRKQKKSKQLPSTDDSPSVVSQESCSTRSSSMSLEQQNLLERLVSTGKLSQDTAEAWRAKQPMLDDWNTQHAARELQMEEMRLYQEEIYRNIQAARVEQEAS